MVTLVRKRDRVVHVVLYTSYFRCRVIFVSYTYEQCLLVASFFFFVCVCTIQGFRLTRLQKHIGRTSKINTTRDTLFGSLVLRSYFTLVNCMISARAQVTRTLLPVLSPGKEIGTHNGYVLKQYTYTSMSVFGLRYLRVMSCSVHERGSVIVL